MLSQKDAVFNAISDIFAEDGREIEGKVTLTKEERSRVTDLIVSGIEDGDVVFSESAQAKYDTPEKIRHYVRGMIGNWLTKDTRLTGGEKYIPKNPCSRAGQGDEIMKNLRLLLKTINDPEQKAHVEAEIEKRRNELSNAKLKNVSINFDILPDELLDQLNLGGSSDSE
jgi:hypothetical protein